MAGMERTEAKRRRRPRPRTQAERSEEMREKLIDATIASLAQDGYTRTSIGRIVRRAKVSNGATGHHFPTKADLLAAAAEELFGRSRHLLSQALDETPPHASSFGVRVERIWSSLHSKPLMRAFLELNMAAQADDELAGTLRDLARRSADEFDRLLPPPSLNRKAKAAVVSPLTRSLMLGMALQYHCWGYEKELSRQLQNWARLVEPYLAN